MWSLTHGGTLRMALEAPAQLDPGLTDDAYEATITNQLFSGLLKYDDGLNILPDIAQSWTVSRDGLTYEFSLRADAVFHHGRPVTAEDFVYSFHRLLDPQQITPGIIQDYLMPIAGAQAYMEGLADHIPGLELVDSHTLKIHLSHPYPSFLAVLAMDQSKVVPKEVIEDLGPEGFARNPVGSGPFKLESWEDDRLVITDNADYFGNCAYLDSVVFIDYPDTTSEQIKQDFAEGKLELRTIRADEVDALDSLGDFYFIRRPEMSLEILGFNVTTPPLNNPKVRQAISMSFSHEMYQQISGGGTRTPLGLLPPGVPGYSPGSKIWREDVARAKEITTELGYGIGNPLEFDLYTASFSAHALKRDSVLVTSLRRAHIVPRIHRVDWLELEDRINTGRADSFFIIWIADLPDPDSFLYTLFSSQGLYNMSDYSNAVVDSLLNTGRVRSDVGERLSYYRRAEQIILDDAACLPLNNFINTYAFQSYVRGVEVSPFGISGIPLNKIWLDGSPSAEAVYAGF